MAFNKSKMSTEINSLYGSTAPTVNSNQSRGARFYLSSGELFNRKRGPLMLGSPTLLSFFTLRVMLFFLLFQGFESRQEMRISLFTIASRPALEPTQPPIQWIPGALSVALKRPAREADHSLPSRDGVKNAWSYTFTPPIRLHGVVFS
jgi:hypothetical protein